MPLVRLDDVSLAYGHRPLLAGASLELARGERVCLIGRNGEGKSTLLRLIAGEAEPDDGEVWQRPGVRIGHLPQEADLAGDTTVFDLAAAGIPRVGELLRRYHRQAATLGEDPAGLATLEALQHRLEAADGWRVHQRVETVLSRLSLDPDAEVRKLSGGWRRRALLARALVSEPDLLLLDEPTNHLDIAAITWLETTMRDFPGALLFISHDRAFARNLATRVIELDRGRLSSWRGGLAHYLEKKALELAAEEKAAAALDRKLSEEEAWIRRGIKARRRRNEGRVRALEKLRAARRARLERQGRAQLSLDAAEESARIVFDADGIGFAYDGTPVIEDFSTRILRGDRVGLVGPNGSGKSTLIRLLVGELEPDTGAVRRGRRLEIAYYDQSRRHLDPKKTVFDSIADGSERVTVRGRSRHVAGYLREFLFPPARFHSPVASLSGGERNRLALARIFTRPANVLVLDEPTNDLDVETLELLEALIADFEGTLLVASHDREFLDNVVTSIIAFEGGGRVREHVGGYSDWLARRDVPPGARDRADAASARATAASGRKTARPASRRPPPGKLSYKDQRELDALPARIETLEAEQKTLQAAVSDPDFYRGAETGIRQTLARLGEIEDALARCYDRWEELETLKAG